MKKVLLIISVLSMLTLVACASDGGNEVVGRARAVVVFEATGESVTVERGATQSFARAGLRLADRDVAVTGAKSNMYLLLNAESVMKMDEASRVEVNRVEDRVLALTLLEGAIAADINRQDAFDRYEINAGNVMMGIRGTSFIVEYRQNNVTVVMLSGSGEVNGVPLAEGNTASVEETGEVSVEPLVIENIESPFIRNEIAERESALRVYGEIARVAVFQPGAAHTEANIVLEFDLLEININEAFPPRDLIWPPDGDYEVRFYNNRVISAQSFIRGIPFITYEGRNWSCGREGENQSCHNGRFYTFIETGGFTSEDCGCFDEVLNILDW
jgi:hypothetical protein